MTKAQNKTEGATGTDEALAPPSHGRVVAHPEVSMEEVRAYETLVQLADDERRANYAKDLDRVLVKGKDHDHTYLSHPVNVERCDCGAIRLRG